MAGDLSGPDTDELMEAAELAEDIELSPEPSGTPPPELGAPGDVVGHPGIVNEGNLGTVRRLKIRH